MTRPVPKSGRTRTATKNGVREDPASAYDMTHAEEGVEQRTLACIVDNEPGVLARVVGLFSARGYNIESLTVAEIDRNAHQSRITIVTSGTNHVLEQIEQQLLRLVPVAKVIDVTHSPGGIQRELALVKVAGTGDARVESLRISEIFRAHVIDTTNESFIFELTGASQKIDQFIELMRPLGLVEVSRTGVLSIQRGKEKAG
jgi:acetolactate synthase-1/3 small subunit